MNDEQIGLFDAIYSQRAIRSFRPDPVPREAIEKMIEAATKAPSAANSQPWAFIVVQDHELRAQLTVLARDGFNIGYEAALARQQPGDPPPMPNLKKMIDNFGTIPAFVIACAEIAPGQTTASSASLFPAVQNLLLAARGLRIGAVLTTGWAMPNIPAIKQLLEIPEHLSPLAFIPLGYPDNARYGPTTRRPIGEILFWDRWEADRPNSAKMSHR